MRRLVHWLLVAFLKKYITPILIILFGVGIIGFHLPALHDVFLTLVAPFLLLCLVLLLSQHQGWNTTFKIWCIGVIIYGIGIEWLGVETSAIFGSYHYGEALGWDIDGIPLIIGVNWLILAYCSKDIAERVFKLPIASILFASFLMVFLDFFIEPVAIKLKFWYWPKNEVPWQNYLGWFGVSAVLFALTHFLKLHWQNKISVLIYLLLLGFFALLNF